MIKNIPYNQFMLEVDRHMKSGGIFLTSKGEKHNTMVIGWGGVNIFWGKPIFLVPVRKSRYTYQLIDKSGEFTVSIPIDVNLKKALSVCGTKSGRYTDKFAECGLTPLPGQTVNVPVIEECLLHYECKVVYKQDMIPQNLDKQMDHIWYPDYHTFFFGEILACYTTR